MNKYLLILLCILARPCYSQITKLNKLIFGNNYEYLGDVVYHSEEEANQRLYEFVLNDTLFLITDIFDFEIQMLKHEYPEAVDIMRYLTGIYHNEGVCENCGYRIVYEGYTPSTLTLYSFLADTIQYTIVPTPSMFQAVIQDTVFFTSHFRCGESIDKLWTDFHVKDLCYFNRNTKNIVIVPVAAYYNSTAENIVRLPSLLLLLQVDQGYIKKIELRRPEALNSNIVTHQSFYSL